MLGNIIGAFIVILIGVSFLPDVAEYSVLFARILSVGLLLFVINIAYSGIREVGLVDKSLLESVKGIFHKMTGKDQEERISPLTGEEGKGKLFDFKQLGGWINFDMMTLTGGMIIIIFTIFFFGAIDVKYDIGLTFDTAIEEPMSHMGETIGDAFTNLFQNIYHRGQENPDTFFYLYIFIIGLWMYNLARPGGFMPEDEIEEES